MTDTIRFHHHASCDSTQELARELLPELAPQHLAVVLADSQLAGRGREGRSWEDPPGAALLLSVAAQGPYGRFVLDDLPRRVAEVVVASVEATYEVPAGHVAWKAPNDLVAGAASGHGGAKLAGILIDVTSTASSVTHLVVGIGANLGGGSFRTSDGRRAVAVDALVTDDAWFEPNPRALAERIARGVERLLSAPR